MLGGTNSLGAPDACSAGLASAATERLTIVHVPGACRQPTFPVLKSLRNTMIYHLGSVALGAFIIAIIQFVRVSEGQNLPAAVCQRGSHSLGAGCTDLVKTSTHSRVGPCLGPRACNTACCAGALVAAAQLVLEYIDKKTRAMQQQNQIAAWAMCIVRGLVWLLEKIVAFINRNAFILVAGTVMACAARGVRQGFGSPHGCDSLQVRRHCIATLHCPGLT